jgi:hypothetical protein
MLQKNAAAFYLIGQQSTKSVLDEQAAYEGNV